jgi:hypothetical protein
MFQKKLYRKSQHFMSSNFFIFRKSCCLRDNVEKYNTAAKARDDNIMQCMCFACWITKATNTHSEYVMIFTSLRQQWFRKSASTLSYTYLSCLVRTKRVALLTQLQARGTSKHTTQQCYCTRHASPQIYDMSRVF